ncbi:MAG: hypothetical protein RJA44_224 [Pseudomonadota bacterium]
MSDDAQDKQLPATARRIEQAREEGQVPRSRDLGHAAVLAGGLALLMLCAPLLTNWLRHLLATGLRFDVALATNPALMTERLAALVLPALAVALLLAVVLSLMALLAAVLSGGWVWSLKAMRPDFSKLDPLTGLGNIFSKNHMGDMLKTCLLALLLGLVGGLWLRSHLEDFVHLQAMPLPAALAGAGDRLVTGLWMLMLVLIAFALVDVPLQRFMHLARLKMSFQEIKEEFRQQEGSPEVKVQLRNRMREMSRKRMLAAVPQASLVVTNPTHYAVALKYEEGQAGAPIVVAMGADLLAQKIRELAREAQVPVLEAPPLARALYAHSELDREIPLALYSAVAQVLAYVFQLRAALVGRAPMPGALPEISVPPELDPHHPKAARAAESP